ncbi:hypothetical protein THIX_10046 [Thiomonas sp. X19]|nr:hypothetical protein THIX_10046 [Thiomonas sp. X19]
MNPAAPSGHSADGVQPASAEPANPSMPLPTRRVPHDRRRPAPFAQTYLPALPDSAGRRLFAGAMINRLTPTDTYVFRGGIAYGPAPRERLDGYQPITGARNPLPAARWCVLPRRLVEQQQPRDVQIRRRGAGGARHRRRHCRTGGTLNRPCYILRNLLADSAFDIFRRIR